MSTDRRDPPLLRTIVCAYDRQELPVSWLQVFRRFERAVARADLAVRVRLDPIDDLPQRFEVLVVPPELLARADLVARGARVIATTRQDAPAAVTALLDEVGTGSTLRAERRRPDAPFVVTRRGSEEL